MEDDKSLKILMVYGKDRTALQGLALKQERKLTNAEMVERLVEHYEQANRF